MYIVAMEMECKKCGCRHISHNFWEELELGTNYRQDSLCWCLMCVCVCACVSPKFVGINYSFTIGCGQSQGSPLLELFLFSNKDCKLAVPHCC